MTTIEIIIIIICIIIVGGVLGKYIYRKVNNLPTGECSCCSVKHKKSNIYEMYRKDNPKYCQCGCEKK